MKPTKFGLAIAALISLLSACGRRGEVTQSQPSAADRALKRIKTVSSTRPVTWDPPADAIVAGSSRYVVLKAGKGHEPVRADKGIICNIAYVVYGRDGKQVTASAAWLQDYDGYRPEMRSVLGGMTAGEIRRAWITERNGKKRVIDIEMSSLFIDRPEPSPATRPESRSPH